MGELGGCEQAQEEVGTGQKAVRDRPGRIHSRVESFKEIGRQRRPAEFPGGERWGREGTDCGQRWVSSVL